MLGSWWFGGPSSPDSNYLRVANAFPNRRLSDNTLMTPKIRIAPSCASSPGNRRKSCFFIWNWISHVPLGGTPGGGLPIRRHSSIGPQGKLDQIFLDHYQSLIEEFSSFLLFDFPQRDEPQLWICHHPR